MKKEVSVLDHGILKDLDATGIAEKIKAKEFTAQEVLDCVKERAEIAEPKINAIVSSDFKLKDYKTEGVFAGVPMFVKDLIDVKGFPNRLGSAGLPDKVRKKDDPFIPQLLNSGCYIIGKSATSEFGLLPSCETIVNGVTQNPHKIGYSTGGSSGGAAALVASGVVPIAHTMDGGGSTRIPACCCGLIGLKPSRGRQLGSITKPLPIDIVTHGIVSRTVRDTANYFHAMEQHFKHPKYPEIGLVKGPSKKRLKIAVFGQSPAGVDSNHEVVEVTNNAGKLCEELGHEVHYISNPYTADFILDFLSYYSKLAWISKNTGFLTRGGFKRSKLENFTKEFANYAKRLWALAPGAIRRIKKKFVPHYEQVVSQYDVLISPTLAEPVKEIGYYGLDVSIEAMVLRLNSSTYYTIVQNATGAPAISLPLGKCKNGLPIGPQFATKIGHEKKLLELAFEIEAANALLV